MILISVAHSAGSGAFNKKFNLQEYNCSQVMSKACSNHLTINSIENEIFDVGVVDAQAERKKLKKEYIKKVNPKLAIEIHLNSDGVGIANYSSCFTWKDNESTFSLSREIINNFKIGMNNKIPGGFKSFIIPSDGFDSRRFWFLSDNACDSIIIEPCFISNDEQAKYLLDESYLNSIGYMVAEAIISWNKKK